MSSYIFLFIAYIEILENPSSSIIYGNNYGQGLTLTCSASAYPPPVTVLWFKNGNMTTVNNVTFVTTTTDSSNIVSILNISSPTAEDVGSYFCQFSTHTGSVGTLKSKAAVVTYSR